MSDQVANGQTAVAAAPVRTPLQFEADNFDSLYRMARALSVSNLLPDALRGKPEDLVIVLMQGRELGLAPMQSLRGIHVIKGRATMAADLLGALVLNSPVCEYLTLLQTSESSATYETKRKGAPRPVSVCYTFAEAEKAGLTGKDNWRNHRQAMLRARALSSLCRAVYPDLVYGIYVHGEIPGDPTIEPDLPGDETTAPSAPVVIEHVARKPETISDIVDQDRADKRRRTKKIESAGAAVAREPDATSHPATETANPTEPTPTPPPETAAPAAPSPATPVVRPAKADWLDAPNLITTWLGAVHELAPDVSSSLLKLHGGTRGHADGCLGLRADPEKQERLMIELKEAGVRKRAGVS